VIEAAITDSTEAVILHLVADTGLSSIVEEVGAAHSAVGRIVDKIPVSSRTLTSVLEESGLPRDEIHFISIDTEGSELAVLKSVDLDIWRPWVFVVEATAPTTTQANFGDWEPILLEADYVFCLFDGLSRYYVAKERYDQIGSLLEYPACIFDQAVDVRTAWLEQENSRLARELLELRGGNRQAPLRDPSPRLDLIDDPVAVRRVLTTISCTDSDAIPKVVGAGSLREADGTAVQIMHNGLLLTAGSYHGQWMTEIIRSLRGHHEPQEEAIFHAIVERLQDTESPTMIEFGSFWTYYGLWFAKSLPKSRVLAMEPDPGNLKVGLDNARINDLLGQVRFLHGAIGASPGATMNFEAESDGHRYEVEQHDLDSAMAFASFDQVDLVLADVQGAEAVLLERAENSLKEGRVRFMIVSTHHRAISGDPLTHQRARERLVAAGASIIAEHSVSESFSGDGLIAVSFHEGDRDWSVPISFARSKDTLFGEVELEVDYALKELETVRSAANLLEREREDLHRSLLASEGELERMRNSRLWRALAPVRRLGAAAHQRNPTRG